MLSLSALSVIFFTEEKMPLWSKSKTAPAHTIIVIPLRVLFSYIISRITIKNSLFVSSLISRFHRALSHRELRFPHGQFPLVHTSKLLCSKQQLVVRFSLLFQRPIIILFLHMPPPILSDSLLPSHTKTIFI